LRSGGFPSDNENKLWQLTALLGRILMAKRWCIHHYDSQRVAELERLAHVPPLVAQLLIRRGMDDPRIVGTFLDARLADLRDPDELPGISAAAERIHYAIAEKQKVTIYGDYDADGMTATAILVGCLRSLGANVDYYVPNRLNEGYGLNHEALRKLAADGTRLVITVDCGIASLDEADTAAESGLDLIVTDHHMMSEQLPKACVIVHPRLPGHDYPFPDLCGAGVAFKLAWAICQRASDSKKVSPRLKEFLVGALGLAAIGTVADVVPLLDENRLIVRHGLKSLKGSPSVGLAALMHVTKLDQKPQLVSEDIAFSLGPRLNAAGRLGQAELAVELLLTESPARAEELAEYIHELNTTRDSIQRSIYLAAHKQLKEKFDIESDPAFVLSGTDWHAGVIGIVAGRLAEKHHRPVILLTLDKLGGEVATGSARSASGLHLYEALKSCQEHLLRFGGHAAAAGMKIKTSEIDQFRAHFCEHVAGEIPPERRIAELDIDTETTFVQLTLKTVGQLEQLAPFGQSNPRPVLCASGVQVGGEPRTMGEGDRHLAVTLKQQNLSLRSVAFGQGEWASELKQQEGPLDVAFRAVINEFRGRRSVELHLVDWRPSTIAASVGS